MVDKTLELQKQRNHFLYKDMTLVSFVMTL